ncbi:MAG: helix-turn-helix transcriptional regulator [Endomicrobium sp.]|nr:helix-turn-helix transcriptional regulator [Endomicrobium sp.]
MRNRKNYTDVITMLFMLLFFILTVEEPEQTHLHALIYNLSFVSLFIGFVFSKKNKLSIKDFSIVQNLSEREKEVFFYFIENPEKKYTDISSELSISEKTVSTHLSNIYKKLNVRDKNELLKVYSGVSKGN